MIFRHVIGLFATNYYMTLYFSVFVLYQLIGPQRFCLALSNNGRPRVHMEGHYILSRFFLFRTPSSEVTALNSTKLCYMFKSESDFKIDVQNLGSP